MIWSVSIGERQVRTYQARIQARRASECVPLSTHSLARRACIGKDSSAARLYCFNCVMLAPLCGSGSTTGLSVMRLNFLAVIIEGNVLCSPDLFLAARH